MDEVGVICIEWRVNPESVTGVKESRATRPHSLRTELYTLQPGDVMLTNRIMRRVWTGDTQS
jgi:hypothetical protein